MKKRVLLLGTFDTKAAEFGFLRDELIKRGAQVVTMDVGSFRANVPFRVDYTLREMMARETAGGKRLFGSRQRCICRFGICKEIGIHAVRARRD